MLVKNFDFTIPEPSVEAVGDGEVEVGLVPCAL